MSRRLALLVLLLPCLLLAASCEDPNKAPAKPTFLDLERRTILDDLPWPAGSTGGKTLAERMTHHGVGALAIGLIEGGELRLLVPAGRKGGAEVTAATLFDATPVTEVLLAIALKRLEQQGGSTPLTAELARRGEVDWLTAEILQPLKNVQGAVRLDDATLRWQATAGEVAALAIDLQKSAAGRPARRLRQEAARGLLRPGGDLVLGPMLAVGGQGHGQYFGRRGQSLEGSALLHAFVGTGQGAAILTDSPQGLAFSEELLAALSSRYNWPAVRR